MRQKYSVNKFDFIWFLIFHKFLTDPFLRVYLLNLASSQVALTPHRVLTSIMWPVEMSMLAWAGSSHQEGVLLWELGLGWAPSLNWDETLLTLESVPPPPTAPPATLPPPPPPLPPLAPPTAPRAAASRRPKAPLEAICWRHRSWWASYACTVTLHSSHCVVPLNSLYRFVFV